VPQLSSRPGAPFTIYINVAGFDYSGAWADPGDNGDPGVTLGLNDTQPTDTFNATEVDEIKNLWSRAAQSYYPFNVSVTTVDPAVAAGQAGSDADRLAYYDSLPNFMNTIVGSQLRDDGNGGLVKWFSDDADGVSQIAAVTGVAPGVGHHTNFMFTEEQQGSNATNGVANGDYIGAIISHENAHAFGLYHQGDWDNGTLVNEYSLGDDNGGPGSYVPIIGQASDRQRVTWRAGDTGGPNDTETFVNDVEALLATNVATNGRAGAADLHFATDTIGDDMGTATPLPLIGSDVDPSLAKGLIVPRSESAPEPIGFGNYTEGRFSFYTDGMDAVSLTLNNGTNFFDPTMADGVGTLRSFLEIYDENGDSIATGVEDSSTLFTTYMDTLAEGNYFAQVSSFGGHMQDAAAFNDAFYFDMGAYFLTGSGFDVQVPEPGTMALILLAMSLVAGRRLRS